jgi:hypothetical protein
LPNLYVFIDESGNFDFSNNPGASEWLVLTSLMTTDASEGIMALYETKHDLIRAGHDIEEFHAAEDAQMIRDSVFPVLAGLKQARVDSLAVRKRRLTPSWRKPDEFYPRMMEYLLQYPFDPRGLDVSGFDHVTIFMDRVALPRKLRGALIGSIKSFLRSHLSGVPYSIHMHDSRSHLYLQAVDYLCCAMAVKRERQERRPYTQISHLVESDFDIFAEGSRDWY